MSPEKRLKQLARAMKRLRPEQGRVARRNARGRVLRELAELRREVDAAYPNIPKARRKPPAKKRRRQEVPRGYTFCGEEDWRAVMAAEGIRPRLARGIAYWPVWAVYAESVTQLRRLKRHRGQRRAFVASLRLRSLDP